MVNTMKPRIGVLLGDPSGIGPELVGKLLKQEDIYEAAEVLVIGDYRLFEMAQRFAGANIALPVVTEVESISFAEHKVVFLDYPTISPEEVTLGQVNAKAGKSVYDTLLYSIELAQTGKIDGFIFAPFNKEAMHLGGSPYDSELELFMDKLDRPNIPGEINVLENLWATRVTSHVPISKVSSLITKERVHNTIVFLDDVLQKFGFENPRLAVAALNPHGGEGGMFGSEEMEEITPAIEKARAGGIDAAGPFPADTLFLRVKDEYYDGVITMYHDQGQTALKLLGFDQGVTVHGGLPFPIATAAHGTAFDIAGKGKANPESFRRAFFIVQRMVKNQNNL